MSAETSRVSEEIKRSENEETRQAAEAERVSNEDARKAAEAQRINAESERAEAEKTRTANEAARVAAEKQRTATFTELSANVDAAVSKANTAAGAANTITEKANAAEDKRAEAFTVLNGNMNTAISELNKAVAKAEDTIEQTTTALNAAKNVDIDIADTTLAVTRPSGERKEFDLMQLKGDKGDAFTYADFTPEEIKELQKPATEAATNADKKAEEASRVNAVLTGENVLEVTNREGVKTALQLASYAEVGDVVSEVKHLSETMGAYTGRADIILKAVETNKAISSAGAKINKSGWAIAEFTAEKGNVYLFKPNVIDDSVCIFAEYIQSVETRGIDYTYTYNTDGTTATATATYLGATHTYTYTYAEDKSCVITDEKGAAVDALPMVYETKVGTYSPLVSLNADAELPKDGYCRYMSHFKGNSAIKVVVSYKVGVADLTMKVTRDGVLASVSTQLGNLSQKEDETRRKIDELHGNYIELKWNADSFCYVDWKYIEVKAFKKYRFKPIYALETCRQFDSSHYPNGNHLVYADVSHFDATTFAVSTYPIEHKKRIDSVFFGAKIEKLDCRGMNVSGLTDINQVFKNCAELTELDISGWDTSECRTFTDFNKNSYTRGLFGGCSKLRKIYGLSGLDTRNVTDMGSLFRGCSALTSIDVSKWDTRNVTDMNDMFNRIDSMQSLNISNFDTRKAKVGGNYGFMSSDNLRSLDMSGDNFTLESTTNWNRGIQTPNLRTLKLGKNFFKTHESIKSLSFSYQYWTDSSVRLSLVTNLYDRKANGLPDLTLLLSKQTKAVLSEDDFAAMTAKGYIIA